MNGSLSNGPGVDASDRITGRHAGRVPVGCDGRSCPARYFTRRSVGQLVVGADACRVLNDMTARRAELLDMRTVDVRTLDMSAQVCARLDPAPS